MVAISSVTMTPSVSLKKFRYGPSHRVSQRVVPRVVTVARNDGANSGVQRRVALGTALLSLGLVTMGTGESKAAGFGKNTKELAKESRKRREKLKEAARKMKEEGKPVSAFAKSDYSVSEEATTPNAKNRNDN